MTSRRSELAPHEATIRELHASLVKADDDLRRMMPNSLPAGPAGLLAIMTVIGGMTDSQARGALIAMQMLGLTSGDIQ